MILLRAVNYIYLHVHGLQVRSCWPLTLFLGQVFATDNDTDPWNSHIDYSIQFFTRDYPFTVEQDTGIIRTQLQNFEKSATFLFGIAATDRGIHIFPLV